MENKWIHLKTWFISSLVYGLFVSIPMLWYLGDVGYDEPLFWVVVAPAFPWALCWLAISAIFLP
jgi:hypothetical protein